MDLHIFVFQVVGNRLKAVTTSHKSSRPIISVMSDTCVYPMTRFW